MTQLTPEQIEARREEFYNKTPFADIFCNWLLQEGIGDFWDNWKWYVNRLDRKYNKNLNKRKGPLS